MGIGGSVEKSTENKSEMPLFKKKDFDKKLLQDKLRLAEEKPDSIFDLANIGIPKIPESVYAKCKVLQKQALLLQHNLLEDLKSGGNLKDLAQLVVLDLSHNNLKAIPKEMKELVSLKRLDLSHNKLKKLPEEIGGMRSLEVFNVSVNDLSGLPPSIKYFQQMTTLDISSNKYITNLPVNLCFLNKLTDFKFDVDKITYPKREFTSQGIKEIQRFFKKLKGEDYFAQDNLDCVSTSPPLSPLLTDDSAFEESILERERKKQTQYEDRLKIEQEILDSASENAKLLVKAQQDRQRVLSDIEKNELEAQTALAKQFNDENQERNKLLEQLYLNENHLDATVNLVLQMSERGKQTEALLEELGQEQARIDALVKITNEESERLRKQEMIEAMNYVLNEMAENQRRFDAYENNKQEVLKKTMLREEEDQGDLEKVLRDKDKDQEEMLRAINTEEEKQRTAFLHLQFQKDARLTRIKKQVDMIEAELARLSLLEMRKREEKNQEEVNTLAEMRIQTAVLLSQLIDEQEKREERLKNTVIQLEEQREDQSKDYWLIQFQRLMDNKPQVLIDDENRLDVHVAEILLQSHAKEYLPHFARHKVTEAQINSITRDRLKEIGVFDVTIQDNILANVKSFQIMNDKFSKRQDSFVPTTTPSKSVEDDPMPPTYHPPSAPDMGVAMNICTESECVICLENPPTVVFLTCGHVCCCAVCCQPITDCPLCRQKIVQKCRLYRST